MNIDATALSLNEITRIQELLSAELRRRFTRNLALCFTDIVGSTRYVSRFGDEASRRLHHRHFELLRLTIGPRGGQIVDTPGDGAFFCFSSVDNAVTALTSFYQAIQRDNVVRPLYDELSVRCGLHWGEVLTDWTEVPADALKVSGESVHLCARVAKNVPGGEIRLTREAFQELPSAFKLRSVALPDEIFSGIARPVSLFKLEWQERGCAIVSVRIDETGQELPLPPKDTITFGRFVGDERKPGNDIVLTLPDQAAATAISRYHFELRRSAEGFNLRSVSKAATLVDGKQVRLGEEAAVRPGSVVKVANTITLCFSGSPPTEQTSFVTRVT